MSNGESASRELAPAISGRERTENDPPVMQQFCNEIDQARCFVEDQTSRVRHHTDQLFGMQPETETEGAADKAMEEVRPMSEIIGTAIRMLHGATAELSQELDRLESHRLV